MNSTMTPCFPALYISFPHGTPFPNPAYIILLYYALSYILVASYSLFFEGSITQLPNKSHRLMPGIGGARL